MLVNLLVTTFVAYLFKGRSSLLSLVLLVWCISQVAAVCSVQCTLYGYVLNAVLDRI